MKTVVYFLSIFSVSFLHAQKLNLQLNLKAGETYTQVQTAKLTIDQNINGQNQEIEMTIGGKMAYHVNAIQDSVFLMDVSFESLSIEMKSSQGSMQVSSSGDDTTNIMERILKTLVHQPIFARMTRRGRFLEVRSDSLIQRVVNHFTEIPVEQKVQIKQQLQQTWGEEAFKSSFEMLSAVYPAEQVKVGDKWPIKSQLKSTMLLNLDAIYTFTGISADGYAIHGDIKLSPAANNIATNLNGMPVLYDLSGTTVSDIVLNKETLWISKASMKQTLSGNASIKDSEQVPGGLTIPMTMTSQTTLSEK